MAIMKILILVFILSTLLFASPPKWIMDQSIDGYICGVGISDEKNKPMRERIAIVSARANLVENISVEIKSYFKIHKQNINGKNTKVTESLIEQKAHMLLSNTKIKERYIDNDGTLYILVILPKSLKQIVDY